MKRKSFNKTGRQKLDIMFRLKKLGYSYARIARTVNVNHTTVLYWFNRLGKKGPTTNSMYLAFLSELSGKPIKDIAKEPIKKEQFRDSVGIINRGKKNYAEYLKYDRRKN